MNVKEYIVSGIVESYVLGLASQEEMAEFERMCAAHQEVRMAREAFEQQLEQRALANGIKPPANLQSKIFAELEIETDKLKSNGERIVADQEMVKSAPVTTMRWWKYATAAAVILLLGSAALNIYYANQARTYKNLYTAETNRVAEANRVWETRMKEYEDLFAKVRDTNMIAVIMPGVQEHPESKATVYWDKQTKDVYLVVNMLSQPPQGKQYQLWAMVNGKPTDAGVLDWNDSDFVARMKNIPVAQGFAITLENEGGAAEPNLKELRVIKMM